MKKDIIILVAMVVSSMMMDSCSDSVSSLPEEKEGTGTIAFTIDFARDDSRASDNNTTGSQPAAPVSTAIPLTSWDNIHSLQIFLYDQNNYIVFSRYIDGAQIKETLENDPFNTGKITYTYANVPNGTYHLMAVANANSASENVLTYLDGLAMKWDERNVINSSIHRCRMEHKPSVFPAFYLSEIAQSGLTRNEKPFAEPAEIFMGAGRQVDRPDNMVQVLAEQEVKAEIKLERQVSMMRLRLNLAGNGDDLNNADVNLREGGLLNFSSNASVMIATLPSVMLPLHDDLIVDGVKYFQGVSPLSNQSDVMVLAGLDGEPRPFRETNPTVGYVKSGYAEDAGFPGEIVNIAADPYHATSWRDILVMPNDKNRMLTDENPVINENRYLLIISAMGLPGHRSREGVLEAPHTVYWTGYINEPFEAGKIREVNISFKDGGSQELPVRPDEAGTLTIVVKEPRDWNPVHKVTHVEL